jgi:hypothetical protein
LATTAATPGRALASVPSDSYLMQRKTTFRSITVFFFGCLMLLVPGVGKLPEENMF